MNESTPPPNANRETMLALMLLTIGGAFLFLFLNFVSLGMFFYVALITGVVGLVASFHYVLWGRGLLGEVSLEREKFLREQAKELEQIENPYAIQPRPGARPRPPRSTPDDRIQ